MSNINWNEFEVKSGEKADRNFPEKGKDLKVGDGVCGVLLGIQTGVGRNKSNVYLLKTDEGETVGVWGSTVIDARLNGVKEGQKIAIEYLGEVRGKNNTYKNFKIGVGKVSTELPSVQVEEGEARSEDIPF